MPNPPDPSDRTVFQPVASGAPSQGATASFIDARQIGLLSAINPLVASANPLLMTMASLRGGGAPANVDALRQRLLEMVKDFDLASERLAVPDDQRHLARYALCTVLDETIQRTSWSGNANWARQSLLIHCFRENWGGEKFFQILDKLVETPAKYAWLLQFFYVCLSLGFMGRFLLQEAAGRQAVGDLRERLYNIIRQGQPEVDRVLSPQWRGLSLGARTFRGFLPMWLVLGAVAMVCLLVYSVMSWSLADARGELALNRLALVPTAPSAMALAPAAKPRLKPLLANEEAAKLLKVDETQLESTVTLVSEATFESGSATPAAGAARLIDRVAGALQQVEGRIVVTGHTDNVAPRRGGSYASNFELSTARAKAVADVMRAQLKDPTRLSFEGRGDAQPVSPEANDSAEGRAKNRRVVISLRVNSAVQ